jgi:DNA repair exonuclease SbcCD ATPase subunit
MAISPEVYDTIIKIVDQRMGELKVTHEDFSALRESVRDLVEAQRRTEESVRSLAEAQRRTDERLDGLTQQMQALAEAQRRTDERLDGLTQQMQALAEAQRRTDERLDGLTQQMQALAEAQRRTDESMKALAEAQKGLAAAMQELALAQVRTDKSLQQLEIQVGKLSDSIGFGLEDVAKLMLPDYLSRRFGIPIIELDRKFFSADEELIEIDLYGEGKHDGQEVVVVAESKARIYEAEVKRFARQLKSIEPQLAGANRKIIKAMFGFYIHPSAQPPAQESDILLVASYQRPPVQSSNKLST